MAGQASFEHKNCKKSTQLIDLSIKLYKLYIYNLIYMRRGGEMVDAKDLKSFEGFLVPVRVRPPAPSYAPAELLMASRF
jgi:hypothetical protein